MKPLTSTQITQAIEHFFPRETLISYRPYGSGHINDTFLLEIKSEEKEEYKAILQRMNTEIFTKPVELMENILNVTSYLREQIIKTGGDPLRETLTVYLSDEDLPYYQDEEGNFFRVYRFITDAISYDQVEKPDDFYQSALAFGHFQKMLSEYPAHTLHETIPGFHDTKARLATFEKAVAKDSANRVSSVKEEIQFVRDHAHLASIFGDLLAKKEIPLRVTHNDTKLNNIMMDKDTRKGICVIDLDTVMPGLAMNDFGDSIRFGASTGAEDETDLSKIACDLDLFALYTKGFLEGCEGKLTPKEVELLPMGALVMTYECGMRFLTDHLEGDHYFKIHRPNHNLDRARTQFKLVADMEKKWDKMKEIVKEQSTQ